MVERSPNNALARFGLANELLKAKLYAEAAEHLQQYLAMYDDEGNGYGRYAESLEALGRTADACEALRKGIAASHRFGHPGMAGELTERLEALGENA